MSKTFSKEELEQGDGQDGQPSLVSVQGKVYDVSDSPMWAGGEHMGAHHAGAELSEALRGAPHGAEVMERVTEVGAFEGGVASTDAPAAAAVPDRQIGPDELAQADGHEGRPAFVAVDGTVYDVSGSGMWSDGAHMNSHHAGRELSVALQAAPHGPEVMERVTAVGRLAEPAASVSLPEAPTTPAWAAFVLGFHPHPVSVHFPIALCATAALFMLLHLVLGVPGMETAALYNLGLASLSAPPAIATGLLSWRFNYGGLWTPIFRKKAWLSAVLMLLAPAALVVRLALPGTFGPGAELHWVWGAMVVVTAPTVVGLGFLGGNITFPR